MHIYLVIYKGISEWPVAGKPVDPKTYWAEYQRILHEDGEPFFPVAVSKDAIFNLLVGTVVVALAVFVGAAHLGVRADPTAPANPRPDWYLIWYFALLALIPPAAEDYFIILFPAVAFLLLFMIPLANKGERHPARRPWAVAAVLLAAFGTAVGIYSGYESAWAPVFTANNGVPTVPATATKNISSTALRGAHLMTREGCMSCHMINGAGGRRGPDLTYVGDRLSEDELIWRLLRGGGGMPAYGNVLKPKETEELISFLGTRKATGPAQAASGGG
jgi:ubiquinol-cytochrome c reductase cytochrome b subunit